jgi:hypothetical protein
MRPTNCYIISANSINKMPNFERNDPPGKLEQLANFLDPVLSSKFHCPEVKKTLCLAQ